MNDPVENLPAGQESGGKRALWGRIREGLKKTGQNLSSAVGNLIMGKKEIDKNLLDEIETQLLMADIGNDVTHTVIEQLSGQVARNELGDPEALYASLKKLLEDQLRGCQKPLVIDASRRPYVLLVVGVNGVGKTTTIGKLAKRFQREGKSVMLAAGDTFRAAAVEQLQIWGDRNQVPVIAQHKGADSASVIFDAIQSARARQIDVLIADTAGRLHNKDNLMEELKKVIRVIKKLDDTAPHEVLLILDAGTGQNAILQTEQFRQAVNVTGMVLTKLDGTAKGGIIFALGKKFGLPIRFIGVGETADDLQPFNAHDFVKALFAHDKV
jgi:fused signal recognition particle receptor